ncbi:MAG: oligosaccharide flippase family protein [Planctomycetaceae bacterium]|nr:oligosaccharide flippase family protein [Planctomycetaceae bacterium]
MVIADVFNVLMDALTLLLLVRLFAPSEFGVLVILLSWVALSESFWQFSTSEVLLARLPRLCVNDPQQARITYGICWAIEALAASLASLTLVSLYWLLPQLFNEEIGSKSFYIAAVLPCCRCFNEPLSAALHSLASPSRILFTRILVTLVRGIAAAAAVIGFGSINAVLMAMSAAAIFRLACYFIATARKVTPAFNTIRQMWIKSREFKLAGFLRDSSLIGILSASVTHGETLLLGYFVGPSAVAVYSVAMRCVSLVSILGNALISSMTIELSKVAVEDIGKAIKERMAWSRPLVGFSILTVSLAALLIGPVFGPEYRQSTFVALALIPHLSWLFFYHIRPVLAVQNKQHRSFVLLLVSVLAFFVVSVSSIPFIGVYGMALGQFARIVVWILMGTQAVSAITTAISQNRIVGATGLEQVSQHTSEL